MSLTANTDSSPAKHRPTAFLRPRIWFSVRSETRILVFNGIRILLPASVAACTGSLTVVVPQNGRCRHFSIFICPASQNINALSTSRPVTVPSTEVFWQQKKALPTRWRGGCRTPLPTTPTQTRPTEASLTALNRLIINLFLPGSEALKLFNFLWRYFPWDLRSQVEIKKYGSICEGPQVRRVVLSPSKCRSGICQHCLNNFQECPCI